VAYEVSWAAVSGASEYLIEESTTSDFASVSSRTITGTSTTFTHASASDVTYYYRVKARNRSGNCDLTAPASNTATVIVKGAPVAAKRILPVVGSTPGSAGSFFKTSLQLYNPKSAAISGKIVYHKAGLSGSDSDPSLSYSIAPGKTITYDDLLPAMSAPNGVGSADLIADINSTLPLSSIRIFNDAGSAGTSGMIEEPMRAEDALQPGQTGVIIAPADVVKLRLNIGVRTLEDGASLTITVRDKDGATVKTIDKSFGATFFTQITSAQMLDGYALAGGETLSFLVNSGSAIVYGAATDNTTNDPAMQVARRSE
jgi:hypothetical protein